MSRSNRVAGKGLVFIACPTKDEDTIVSIDVDPVQIVKRLSVGMNPRDENFIAGEWFIGANCQGRQVKVEFEEPGPRVVTFKFSKSVPCSSIGEKCDRPKAYTSIR